MLLINFLMSRQSFFSVIIFIKKLMTFFIAKIYFTINLLRRGSDKKISLLYQSLPDKLSQAGIFLKIRFSLHMVLLQTFCIFFLFGNIN